jgi:hypothetical protein
MNRILTLALLLALSAGAADAKSCKDAKGKFTKCPPAAAKMASPAKPMAAMTSSQMAAMTPGSKAPVCKVGKPCGKSCISKDKVCHK